MSDSEDSTVTYTAMSSPFTDFPNIGSPGVDGPPVIPEDPYAYVDEILPAEEKPLPAAVSPTADSPGYVFESDPEEDPIKDDDGDPKEDLVDYPADGGDDGDDEDESSDDDEDEDVDIEEDEEEEENPAPAESTAVALPIVDQAPSAEETEPFETDESVATPPPHPACRVTARTSIRDEPPTPFWSDMEVARLLAIPTPPPSPLSLWSSPLPQIPSTPLPVLSPVPVISPSPPSSPICSLGYRAAMIRLRAEAPYTSYLPPPHIILSHTRADTPPSGTPPLLPIPLPTSSLPLNLLSTDRRADRPEEIMRDLERDVGYGITDTWDEMPVDMPGAPVTDDTEVGQRMIEFTTRVRQDIDKIYTRLDDEQSERQLMAGRLNILYRDRRAHARTDRLMEAEAKMRQAAIIEMLAADHMRHEQFIEALKLLKRLQTLMSEFERQQGPAKGPVQPDAPEEAGSSS
ncbi:hypothetical protein Tco_0883523 [Tanacetum coccineum]